MSFLAQPLMGPPTRLPQGLVENPVVAPGTTDALPVASANVFVTQAGVDAMTLATPKAGVYPAGAANSQLFGEPRDDGKSLLVLDTTGHAHTITTAANIINGSNHIATFNGTVGSWILLMAFNGIWYVIGSSGVALS